MFDKRATRGNFLTVVYQVGGVWLVPDRGSRGGTAVRSEADTVPVRELTDVR